MTRYWFDWAATAPPNREEQEKALKKALRLRGNPSSIHSEGKEARAFLEDARERCSQSLKLPKNQLYFTSGASESNQIILYSLLSRPASAALVSSVIEHPSIRETSRILEGLGRRVFRPKVQGDGSLDTDKLLYLVQTQPDIRMISLMAVNNETGSITALHELVPALRRAAGSRGTGLHIHCDAVQAIGKTPLELDCGIDSLSLSAHKMGGPRGAGILWCRKKIESLNRGGGQEQGIRGGTENLFGAEALALTLERALEPAALTEGFAKVQSLAARIISGLPKDFTVFPPDRRAADERFSPFIIPFMHQKLPAEALVRLLDAEGFSISSSSACSSNSGRREVLEALGLDTDSALKVARLSLGRDSEPEGVEALLKALSTIQTRF